MHEGSDSLNKLTYESALSLVEKLDDKVRTQSEYSETRLEEIIQHLENQTLLQEIKFTHQRNQGATERCWDDPKGTLSDL